MDPTFTNEVVNEKADYKEQKAQEDPVVMVC
jgi:hypothetical protein